MSDTATSLEVRQNAKTSGRIPSNASEKTASLQCVDLREYLCSKTPQMLESLYNHPAVCLAVFGELPSLARLIITRLLFVEQAVPKAVVDSWLSKDTAEEIIKASKCLSDLQIWSETYLPGGLKAWELRSHFRKNLKIAMLGGGKLWTISHTNVSEIKTREIELLDTYAMSRWRCILHFMVGNTNSQKSQEYEGISPDAVRILLSANLMKRDDNNQITITRQGFQFLLLNTQSQIWYFIMHYLDYMEKLGIQLSECLSMLFQLSYTTLGRDYSSERMSQNMLKVLQHLREFGLVFQRKRKEGRFFPTRLAHSIIYKNNNSSFFDGNDDQIGHIIVETNYRIYGYTDSQLQVSILALFAELICQFPNMVVGAMTRDSVRQALRGGITANQIISYLEQHAHVEMKKNAVSTKTVLPPTVVDQIRLWELERNRFEFTESVVYNQFLSQADYVTLRDYAESINALIWQNERSRTMVVDKNGHDEVKKYWKRYSKNVN